MYLDKTMIEDGNRTKMLMPFVILPAIILFSLGIITALYFYDKSTNSESKPISNLIIGIIITLINYLVLITIHKVNKIDLYVLTPFIFFSIIALLLHLDNKNKNFTYLYGSLLISVVVYLAFRFYSVKLTPGVPDTEVLNNPYLFAAPDEKWATKIFVLLKYMKLLFIPHPLSSDYSFNTIVYRKFTSWDTLLSLFLYISLAGVTFWLFIKKHPLAFGLIFFFANLLMIGNILMDIGATMGERLIYHSSFGFALCIAWLILEGLKKANLSLALQKNIVIGLALVLTGLFGYKTIDRNAEWKNDITLFTTDVNTVPNSVLCLGNAGARWIDLSERPENKDSMNAYVNKAIGYLSHALELHPKYVNGYLNLGLAQMKLGQLDSAYNTWTRAQALYPSNPYLQSYFPYLAVNYMNKGVTLGQAGKLDEATKALDKAIACNPNSYDVWYNYAGVYFTKGNFEKAKFGFENALKLNPNSEQAKNGLGAATAKLAETQNTNTVVAVVPPKK
jgi:tetratricopeptide (TPR) repeat protein